MDKRQTVKLIGDIRLSLSLFLHACFIVAEINCILITTYRVLLSLSLRENEYNLSHIFFVDDKRLLLRSQSQK